MEHVRIGMVGCGGFGRWHLGHYPAIREASVVALCDPDPAQIEATHAAHPWTQGAAVFSNHRDLIAADLVDAVVLVTPHADHLAQIEDAFGAKLHVMVEKPLCPTVADCGRAIAARDAAQRIGLLSYQRHTQSDYRYLRTLVQSGALGELRLVSAYLAQEWKPFTAGSWRQDPARSCGGMLFDSGSHMLDAMLWCSGLEPLTVGGFLDNRGTPVEIDSVATIRFSNGALGTLTVCGDAPGWREEITFIGDRGSVLLRDGRITVFDQHGAELQVQRTSGGSTPDRNFVDAILGRDTVRSPFECGLAVTRLTQAVYRSAELGGMPVAVAD